MRIPVAALLILSVSLAGCGGGSTEWHQVKDLMHSPQLSNRSDKGEPIRLAISGPVAIDVESFNGDVIIRQNSDLVDQALVRVDRVAVHGYKRKDEGLAALSNVTFDAQIVPGELGQTVQVRTGSSDPEPHYLRANVLIEAAEIDGIRVRTNRGKVFATGIKGAVDIETNLGDVRIATNQAMTQPVTILNREGDIAYRVRGESTGTLDAEAIRGRVLHRVLYGRLFPVKPEGEGKLTATLNEGKNPITLRTTDGEIWFTVVHNPEKMGVLSVGP